MSDRETVPPATAPEVVSTSSALPPEALEIASGYAFTGPALDLGALLWDGKCLPDVRIRIPLPMLNRHGPVAGATGTGKTKTLQLIAEQLSAQAWSRSWNSRSCRTDRSCSRRSWSRSRRRCG